jgi:signal transduction histidine kinase
MEAGRERREREGEADPGGRPGAVRSREAAVVRLLAGEDPVGVAVDSGLPPEDLERLRARFLEGGRDALDLGPPGLSLRASLRERVKELSCLYGISQILARRDGTLDSLLREVVALLPRAWQHPERASARLVLDGISYGGPDPPDGAMRQVSDLVVDGVRRGTVEVAYSGDCPPADEGPFLKEERSLLDEAARQVARLVERREDEETLTRLEVQLLHADRLATIGQLASGVAHELNEPLAAVLGFAQLVLKERGLPPAAVRDLEKIRFAALHAREVVRKLLLFARPHPARKSPLDLNLLVEEALDVLRGRCASAGIEVALEAAPGIPPFLADPIQVRQVVVNLVVNAIQAMPRGGVLTLRTAFDEASTSLVVEDTGVGMTPEVKRQAFVPFFTTKDIGEGTGLGLSVVHGIVKGHGGTILVESEPGRGTRIEIRFPANGGVGDGRGP